MALTPMCGGLQKCGYLCGFLAALNLWFWIGVSIFNSMDNPFIRDRLLKMPIQNDSSGWTVPFIIVALVSNFQ